MGIQGQERPAESVTHPLNWVWEILQEELGHESLFCTLVALALFSVGGGGYIREHTVKKPVHHGVNSLMIDWEVKPALHLWGRGIEAH